MRSSRKDAWFLRDAFELSASTIVYFLVGTVVALISSNPRLPGSTSSELPACPAGLKGVFLKCESRSGFSVSSVACPTSLMFVAASRLNFGSSINKSTPSGLVSGAENNRSVPSPVCHEQRKTWPLKETRGSALSKSRIWKVESASFSWGSLVAVSSPVPLESLGVGCDPRSWLPSLIFSLRTGRRSRE